MIGANIARSIVSCWILWSIASRFFTSRSPACTWARSSMSGYPPYAYAPLELEKAATRAAAVPGLAHRRNEEPVRLLSPPRGVEGGALHRPHLHADTDRVQIIQRRFPHGGEPRNRRELPGVQPVGIAGLRQ